MTDLFGLHSAVKKHIFSRYALGLACVVGVLGVLCRLGCGMPTVALRAPPQ